MCSSSVSNRQRAIAGERLLHPVVLIAMGTLVINDHLLKRLWPSLLTGKLSDVAGLIFFPVFLQALWELGLAVRRRPWFHSQRALYTCAALTAAVFAFAKLSPVGESAYRFGLGALRGTPAAVVDLIRGEEPRLPLARFTRDPSDVLALPAVLLGVWLFRRRDVLP